MGDLIQAECPCGFTQNCTLGGGKLNFKTICGAPAYCLSCKKMLNLNYMEKNPKCPECHKIVKFYNDKSLQSSPKGQRKSQCFGWNLEDGAFLLPAVLYLCPKCQKFSLRFISAGNFD
jgi:hypothetical protein